MSTQLPPARSYAQSSRLFDRACEVIPGGIYGHVAPALSVPQGSPYYASRAEGCRYWDVDGNEFIDFLCGYGPVVLGYRHPEVEEAAERQRRDGDCFNHPGPVMVELAEKLVDLIDFADWAVFAKNGRPNGSVAGDFRIAGVPVKPAGKRNATLEASTGALKSRLASTRQNYTAPWLTWSTRCAAWEATIPSLARDPNNVERIASGQPDHAFDAARYAVMIANAKWNQGATKHRIW